MRYLSHKALGEYLVHTYMAGISRKYTQAFLFGCIEPDLNPCTYLKGSIREQWLRGHNYRNSRNYIRRITARLESRKSLGLIDYYTAGKLIHYIADAFTSAHNEYFSADLNEHRSYEADLQQFFMVFLSRKPIMQEVSRNNLADYITKRHRDYRRMPQSMITDSIYAFSVSCLLVSNLIKPV